MSFKKSLLICTLTVGLGFVAIPNMTNAAPSTVDPACDTVFMDAMKNKAWMETQRETMIAQTIIAKPDSVFALGCFGTQIGNMYGALTKLTVNGDNSQTTITNAISSYLGSAFSHGLGGGHSPSIGNNSTTNDCAVMQKLWDAAKCANVNPSKIMDLNDYSNTETRVYPTNNCSGHGSWTAPIGLIKTPGVGASFDNMNLFTGVVAPFSQTATGGAQKKCSAAIKTGVMIDTIPEAVCPNPGCTPTGKTTPECCPTGTASGGQGCT